jgi:hypothetical protein
MATFTVTKIRKGWSADKTHEHIEGVCTSDGTHYTRQKVVDSIDAGNTLKTSADGYEATIETMKFCPKARCLAQPYIKTKPDSTKKDNLENLDHC